MYYFYWERGSAQYASYFCLLSSFLALIFEGVHIQVSGDVLFHSCFEKGTFQIMVNEKNDLASFSVTNVKVSIL